MKRIQKKDIVIFLILFIISSIIYWNYISMHYATDTYNIMNIGYKEYAIQNSFNDGRFFMFLIGMIAQLVNLPIEGYVIGTVVIAIIISCIAVIILKNMIMKLKPLKGKLYEIIPILISFVTIFNFMYVENLYFVEATVMAVSILLYLLAVKRQIETEKYFDWKSLLLVILATFCYQGTIGFYLFILLAFLLIKHKNDYKTILKKLGVGILFAGASFLLNLIQIKIANYVSGIEQQRLNGVENLLGTAWMVARNFHSMIYEIIFQESCWLFPKNYFLIFVLCILLIGIIYNLKEKEENTTGDFLLLILFLLGITFAMCIVSIASYDTGRIHYPVGTMIGILFTYLYCNTNVFEKESKMRIITVFLLFVYILAVIRKHNSIIKYA